MRSLVLAMAASLLFPGVAMAQTGDRDAAVLAARAEAFVAARNAFDQRGIVAMMAPDYQEISPIGDVDSRDRVIGFYAPDKKVAAPPMTITETVARPAGSLGLVTMKIAYAMPGSDGAVRTRAVRVGFVARRTAGEWRFVSAQFTPIR